MEKLIKIIYKNRLIAVIIKASFKKKGIEFFTTNEFSQQLAYMNRPKGYIINAHIHPRIVRQIKFSQEVIFVKSGKVRIDLYDNKKHYIESRVLNEGDVIFIAEGGHGFKFIKDTEMIEVKQGPFFKEIQPIRFEAVLKNKIKIKK